MATGNHPFRQRLTKEESELRNRADQRESKQRYINQHWWKYTDNTIVEQLRQAHARLMAWGNRNKPSDTDHHPISPWTPGLQQLADTDTIMHPVTPLPLSRITEKPMTPRQLNSFPNTGDIRVNEITQDKQPNKPTSYHTYQDEYNKITQLRQELVTRCQESLRTHYQEQFTLQHPGEEFSQDLDCMARTIKMTALNKLTLGPLDQGKYFPETRVLVEADSSLGDQIICE